MWISGLVQQSMVSVLLAARSFSKKSVEECEGNIPCLMRPFPVLRLLPSRLPPRKLLSPYRRMFVAICRDVSRLSCLRFCQASWKTGWNRLVGGSDAALADSCDRNCGQRSCKCRDTMYRLVLGQLTCSRLCLILCLYSLDMRHSFLVLNALVTNRALPPVNSGCLPTQFFGLRELYFPLILSGSANINRSPLHLTEKSYCSYSSDTCFFRAEVATPLLRWFHFKRAPALVACSPSMWPIRFSVKQVNSPFISTLFWR